MCVKSVCEFGFAKAAVSEATDWTVAGECYFGVRSKGDLLVNVLLGGRDFFA